MAELSEEIKESLVCTMCNKQMANHSKIVYSRGERVCTDCKEICKSWDNRMFDLDMDLRR